MKENFKNILYIIGFPFSPLYSQAMKIRSILYRKGLLKSHHIPVPVISVGNVTMGGSGKTPVVIYLAEMLIAEGYRPAVVSRGYGGSSRSAVTIVSDSCTILSDAEAAGDEPILIAQRVRGAVVATGKKRYLPCLEVIEKYDCDVIILDDGFQHLGVKRDIDLVLFDTVVFAGNSRVFPGGDLREPVQALNRCTAFLITGINKLNMERAEKCTDLLYSKFPSKPVFKARSSYRKAKRAFTADQQGDDESIPLAELPEKLIVFSGIANPERFRNALKLDSVSFLDFLAFTDHHNYSSKDIALLNRTAETSGADAFLTTEKDLARITDPESFALPVFSLPQFVTSDNDFNNFVLEGIREIAGKKGASAR